mmetsp:Transcript_42762/g.99334  ORF Transcript_42762/g.99334 Transcript_42762/m.99334 type:complete len:152 (+) Transcript_42762:207-662(+)
MEGLGKWWDDTSKGVGEAVGGIGKGVGEGVEGCIKFGGEKIEEVSKAVQGGASKGLDLGFITIQSGPKGKTQPGGYHFDKSAASRRLPREDLYDEEDEADPRKAMAAEREKHSVDIGFIRVVQKKAAHVPKSHFSDHRQHHDVKTVHKHRV